MQLESAAGRNEDRYMDQTTYDNMSPDDEPDAVSLGHVETAMEHLEKASRAYRADPPRFPEATGHVEDAMTELRTILRNIY